jgi:hypothetical protein
LEKNKYKLDTCLVKSFLLEMPGQQRPKIIQKTTPKKSEKILGKWLVR